ncbi:c-type cytochrome [Candidatus Anaplasma sp. TIGMIC]|uniref:c-type cytochrome n=1 Tax=Candidatus Anaplasma sp. TIGMIC TaxID=3020713 RepID=UPI00232E90A1|nr:cytochrome c family protein [Candidatus Anaplasma sp. TIGMIC]MDB1135540.1 cytochrome c family protein [Candidatus Anaplasma sp. TIGMIC]
MGGLNFNRIATSVLLASFIILIVSNVVDIVYHPDHDSPRGYSVDVSSTKTAGSGDSAEAVDIDIASLIATASAEKGKVVAKKCSACHTVNKGGPDRVGPNLWGVIGAKKGRVAGFTYSKALLSHGGDWSEEELFKFLSKPQSYISGTRMAFAGLSKPQDIADLLAYLKSLEQE